VNVRQNIFGIGGLELFWDDVRIAVFTNRIEPAPTVGDDGAAM
jgi:hypothetical protein